MAKIICKGTIIKMTQSASLTPIAQVISTGHDGAESETFDSTSLDTTGAGKEYKATGYSEGGSVDLELFWDPNLSGQQEITDVITTPAEVDWEMTFSDSTTAAFTVAGVGFGYTVDMNDGLKASITLKLDQLMTYPT